VFSWSKSNILRLVSLVQENGGTISLESMRQVGLPSLTEGMLVPIEGLMEGLTAKQSDILTLAIERGYYDTPARISADDMAKLTGLSRSTAMEHLRKAEGKVLMNMLPLLRMAALDRK
jgi:hypothetical protein